MRTNYQTHIVQLGNSKGVRLPKEFIASLGTTDIELEHTDQGILIKPLHRAITPRSKWTEILSKMIIEQSEEDLKDWDITLGDGLEDL